MLPPPIWLFALCLLGDDKRPLDTVQLVNGTKLEGRVVYQDEAELVLRKGTRDQTLAMKEIAKVDSQAAHLRDVLESYLKPSVAKDEDLADAANYCERLGLADEEFLLRWKLCLRSPGDESVHKELGHELRDGNWALREGEKWTALKDWLAPREWRNAWRLTSSHFEARCDADYGTGVDALLDLECLYYAFFQRFGRDLHSYETTERIKVEVQGKKRNFSAPMKNVVSWFDARANVIYVDAGKGLDRARLLMDGVRALLCNSGSRQRVIDGVIPPWIDAGLAVWVGWNMHGELGRAVWDPAPAPEILRRALQGDGKEPPNLTKLLNSSTPEFDDSERGQARYAQAFSFIEFLLGSAGEKYRLRFLEFLRNTYRGKGSPPQFYDAVGVDKTEIEGEWLRWLAQAVGPAAAPEKK